MEVVSLEKLCKVWYTGFILKTPEEMTHMKRFLVMLLVLSLFLCACGNAPAAPTTVATTEAPTTEPTSEPTSATNIPDPNVDTSMPNGGNGTGSDSDTGSGSDSTGDSSGNAGNSRSRIMR